MKKVKHTPVPLPGTVPRNQPKSSHAPSKPPLSQEFVDSDSSANETTPRRKASEKSTKPKAQTNIAVHRPKPNGVPKKTQKATPKPTVAPKQVVSKEPDTTASSSEESDNESNKSKNYAQGGSGNKEAVEDASESASSSDTSSDDSDEESVPDATQAAPRTQPRAPQAHTVELRPVQPYVPPKGFAAIPTPLNNSSRAVKLFENLEGKELWHITAPANVSLNSIKEVALDEVSKGGAVLSHKGIDYGFASGEHNEQAAREVLIPRQSGYKAVSTRITQTLHLQQVIRLPNITSKQADQNTGSAAAASITASTIRAPRPQIKGLRMNFFPSGFGTADPGSLGSSDSETEVPAPAGLGVPNGTHVLHKPEKRKREEANSVERIGSPTKKHKEHRTPEEIKRREEKKAKKEKKRQRDLAKGKS